MSNKPGKNISNLINNQRNAEWNHTDLVFYSQIAYYLKDWHFWISASGYDGVTENTLSHSKQLEKWTK